jgi:hypothetical protein
MEGMSAPFAIGEIMNPSGKEHDPFKPGLQGKTELENTAVGPFVPIAVVGNLVCRMKV